MTTHNCTASAADLKNTPYLYPVITSSKALHVAEDTDDYGKEQRKSKNKAKTKTQSMQVDCKALQRHIQKRLKPLKPILPTRLYQTFDDLNLYLNKQDTIELFDLLIEFNINNDEIPAQNMAALMAALNADALIELEQHDIMNAASFIRDTMKYDLVRWCLEEAKKERVLSQEAKAEKKASRHKDEKEN